MKLAIFGGSFNPIHYGHLLLAENARWNFKLDKVIFMPAGRPPHKPNAPLAEDDYRLKMIKLAIERNPAFEASDYELNKHGLSYTYDTLKHFSAKIKKGKDELFFIMGIDLLLQIQTWKKSEGLLDLCAFIVGTRPNFHVSSIPEKIRSRVRIFKTPLFNVSSTYIRKALRESRPIKYLVPEKVEDFICAQKLYGTK